MPHGACSFCGFEVTRFSVPDSSSAEALFTARQLDECANARLLRGLALLKENTSSSLREAVSCFDDAIALRKQLPLAENCWFRYGLIAGWMNRGDALTRLGSVNELHEALRSYKAALEHLRELPMSESPVFVKRLAIAWLNRGVTLLTMGTANDVLQAAKSFDNSIAAARNFFSINAEEGRELLACAWMNHSNALIRLDPPPLENARDAARNSLRIASITEKDDAAAAEIAFKARHILCQTLAHSLAKASPDESQRKDFLDEATDTVDDGMALARLWESRGANQFRAPAAELFRFGCRIYQIYQPHFLTEFLLENLDPTHSSGSFASNLEMHISAVDSLWCMLRDLQQDGFKTVNTSQFDKFLERLRDLRITEERLAELRRINATT
jgi:tetratricopeptide (TPR) repeat protein